MVTGRVPREVTAGQLVASKYRIERVIASGGQGTVVEATHLRLNQSVAIKFPHVDGEEGEEGAFERMFREARASFRLGGAHVARTIDVDVVDGAPFIVMEYLRGVDLKAYVAERGALPVEDAVGLLLQACEAVAEAHDLGIIHRDLKPSNLFLVDQADGSMMLKVLDFGLSKASTLDPETDISDLTEPQRMLGSPRYMSPEQVRDPHHVDARSDIWSMGVILQELLTGAPMFRARTHMQALAMVLTRSPAPVSVLRPDVPPEIERVVLRCLQKIPEHRFANARELAQALAPHAPSWATVNVERMLPRKVSRRAMAARRGRPGSPNPASVNRGRRLGGALQVAALGGVLVGAIAVGVVGRDGIVSLVTHGSVAEPAANRRAGRDGARPPIVVEPIAAARAAESSKTSEVVAAEPAASEKVVEPPTNLGVDTVPDAVEFVPRTRGAAPVVSTKRQRERRRAAEGLAQHKARAASSRLAVRSSALADPVRPTAGALSAGDEPGPLEGRK